MTGGRLTELYFCGRIVLVIGLVTLTTCKLEVRYGDKDAKKC